MRWAFLNDLSVAVVGGVTTAWESGEVVKTVSPRWFMSQCPRWRPLTICCKQVPRTFSRTRFLTFQMKNPVPSLPFAVGEPTLLFLVLTCADALPDNLKKSLWEQFRNSCFQMKMLIWWTLLGVGFGILCGLSLYRSHLPPLTIELIGTLHNARAQFRFSSTHCNRSVDNALP